MLLVTCAYRVLRNRPALFTRRAAGVGRLSAAVMISSLLRTAGRQPGVWLRLQPAAYRSLRSARVPPPTARASGNAARRRTQNDARLT